MKGQMPRIKDFMLVIVIILAIIGFFTVANFFFPQKVDIGPITEGQSELEAKINILASEITAIRGEVIGLKNTGASKTDIAQIDSRLDTIEIEIANIEPQAVQNIDLTNINTYVNNYNIRLIFSVTVALLIIESLNVFVRRKKESKKSLQ